MSRSLGVASFASPVATECYPVVGDGSPWFYDLTPSSPVSPGLPTSLVAGPEAPEGTSVEVWTKSSEVRQTPL